MTPRVRIVAWSYGRGMLVGRRSTASKAHVNCRSYGRFPGSLWMSEEGADVRNPKIVSPTFRSYPLWGKWGPQISGEEVHLWSRRTSETSARSIRSWRRGFFMDS